MGNTRGYARRDDCALRERRGYIGDFCGCETDSRFTGKQEYRRPGTKTGTFPDSRNTSEWCQMREKLMSLYFVIVELELYLDGHPDNTAALARYKCVVRDYKELAASYEKAYGPLTAMGNGSKDEWQWVRQPWPWEV